jgi:hypothetical protein
MLASDGRIKSVAKDLGITQQNTSLLLRKYSELCGKYNIKLRKRATNSFLPKKERIKKNSDSSFALLLQSNRLEHIGLRKGKISTSGYAQNKIVLLAQERIENDKYKVFDNGVSFFENEFF